MAAYPNGFISAADAASGIVTNLAIHSEITDIEKIVLVQSSNGFLNTSVKTTLMTSNQFNSPLTVTAVDTVNNLVTIPGMSASGAVIGSPVTFASSATLPAPLQTNTFYYLSPTTTVDVYGITATKQDAFQAPPNLIDLTGAGTGTITSTLVTQSQLYYNAWQNVYFFPEQSMYVAQMQAVITYFESCGYTIDRRQQTDSNGNALPVFLWYLTW